jgi:ribosomal protein S27E
MAENIAYVDWSLHVDCPACGESNDLAHPEHDTENDIARHIFSNNWERLKGWEVTCGSCNHEFTLDSIEY